MDPRSRESGGSLAGKGQGGDGALACWTARASIPKTWLFVGTDLEVEVWAVPRGNTSCGLSVVRGLNFSKCFKLPFYSKDKGETDASVAFQMPPGKDVNFSITKLAPTEEQARLHLPMPLLSLCALRALELPGPPLLPAWG